VARRRHGLLERRRRRPRRSRRRHGAVRAQLSEADRLARSHLDRRHRLPPRWRAIDAISDYGLRLTAGEAEQLLGAIDALVRPYIAPTRHDAPADAEVVHLSLRAFPRPPATPPPSMT
jgi:hypothetical protein